MQNYQKKLRQYYRIKEKKQKQHVIKQEKQEKQKRTYFDKLYLRMFLSAFLLLGLVSVRGLHNDYSLIIEEKIYQNMNVLKIASFFNGIFGNNLIPAPGDIPVVSSSLYEEVIYSNGVNKVKNEAFAGVENAMTGVIVKITKNTNGLYSVTVKGFDDLEYEYRNLESIDYNIYSYIPEHAIIGKALWQDDAYRFELVIKDKTKALSFYEICED